MIVYLGSVSSGASYVLADGSVSTNLFSEVILILGNTGLSVVSMDTCVSPVGISVSPPPTLISLITILAILFANLA